MKCDANWISKSVRPRACRMSYKHTIAVLNSGVIFLAMFLFSNVYKAPEQIMEKEHYLVLLILLAVQVLGQLSQFKQVTLQIGVVLALSLVQVSLLVTEAVVALQVRIEGTDETSKLLSPLFGNIFSSDLLNLSAAATFLIIVFSQSNRQLPSPSKAN